MPTNLERYRLRIIEPAGVSSVNICRTYIVRNGKGSVDYLSGDQTPLALANLVGSEAAELEFKLEDALDGSAAKKAVEAVLAAKWKNRPDMTPKVEVL